MNTISVKHFYPDNEIKKTGDAQVKFALGLALLDELNSKRVIEYIYHKTEEGTEVTAKLNYV